MGVGLISSDSQLRGGEEPDRFFLHTTDALEAAATITSIDVSAGRRWPAARILYDLPASWAIERAKDVRAHTVRSAVVLPPAQLRRDDRHG